MRYIILIICLINTSACYCQEFVIEKALLTETVENEYISEIPILKDLSNESNPVVEGINSQILDRFMINSIEQSELEGFNWYGVRYSSEINKNILYISFSGEYYGAYPNYVTDELFFDLKSGEPLKLTEIPFQALFTLSGYLDFLNKYWLEGVKNEFLEAIECAETEPYCSYYDINSYNADNNKLSISLTDDCYPHVSQGCSPVYTITVELDSIGHYLNNIGKYILLGNKYMAMTPIEKFLENRKLIDKVTDNLFLFGMIDNSYPFSMAINIDKKEDVSGLYFYDSKLEKIMLKGQINNDSMFLTESVNKKQTGFFEFDINIDNYPIEGRWLNFEKTKSLNVSFNKIILCKNY